MKGFDGGKLINGIKRHLAVDIMGNVLMVIVTAANVRDREGLKLLLEQMCVQFIKLIKIIADGGYSGAELALWVKNCFNWTLEVVNKLAGQVGFQVLPKRWIVERTFGWLSKYRALSKDYEYHYQNSESMVYLVMIHINLRRLSKL
jgi:putative transposase